MAFRDGGASVVVIGIQCGDCIVASHMGEGNDSLSRCMTEY